MIFYFTFGLITINIFYLKFFVKEFLKSLSLLNPSSPDSNSSIYFITILEIFFLFINPKWISGNN